jgi:PEP-CTERM motif
MQKRYFLVSVLALASMTAMPVRGSIVYNNDFGGVISGDNFSANAYNIFTGDFSVANSFVLAAPASVQQVQVALWTDPGDAVGSLDWWFLNNDGPDPLSGSVLQSGTAVAPVGTLVDGAGIPDSSIVYIVNFSVPALALQANTTYWLELDGISQNQGSVFWDVSDGPSLAYTNMGGGYISSESFELLDSPLADDPPEQGSTVPEPGTLILLGGVLTLIGLWRRSKK